MPPTVGLILCMVFVLWLLRIERKQSPNVSYALWIPTIWMLYSASKPLAKWFGIHGDVESGSTLDQYFLSSLLFLGLVTLTKRKFHWSNVIKENIWLMLLIGYMIVSVLWSDFPLISFKRWVRELIAVIMAFFVITEPAPKKALESLFRRSAYILIPFSILLIKYFPHYGVEYGRWSGTQMWIGVTMQKNGLGRLCMISALFLIWSLVKRLRGSDIQPNSKSQTYADVFILIMTLWLLVGPQSAYSATAVGALLGGLAAFVGLLWMNKSRMILGANTLTLIMIIVISFGIITVLSSGSTLGDITSSFGRDETMTGRSAIWASLIPAAMQQPILGSGFGSFWTPTAGLLYNILEAHSGYLDIQLHLGLVGLLLFSIFLLSSCRKAQREMSYDFNWASLWICYLLMAAVHNITESSFNSFTTHLTAIILFLSVSYTVPASYIPGVAQDKKYDVLKIHGRQV